MNGLVDPGVVAAWDTIASAYQERYRIDPTRLHLGPMVPGPAELGLDLDPGGEAVLDYGCGAGQNAIACALAGAHRIVAVDPSARQLALGRELAERSGAQVDFRHLDPGHLDELPCDLDLVLSVYSLQYVPDAGRIVAALARRLRSGGQLVVSVDHPVRTAGVWRDGDFVLGDYFVTGWESWDYDFPEQDLQVEMRRYRRPVGEWVGAFVSAGLRITHLLEPRPPATDDSFGRHSKYGTGDPRNVFSRARLERVPGSLVLVGERDRP